MFEVSIRIDDDGKLGSEAERRTREARLETVIGELDPSGNKMKLVGTQTERNRFRYGYAEIDAPDLAAAQALVAQVRSRWPSWVSNPVDKEERAMESALITAELRDWL